MAMKEKERGRRGEGQGRQHHVHCLESVHVHLLRRTGYVGFQSTQIRRSKQTFNLVDLSIQTCLKSLAFIVAVYVSLLSELETDVTFTVVCSALSNS
jgi:hypothetical protein